MRLLIAAAAAAAFAAVACAETIEAFGRRWTVPVAADWRVDKEGGVEILRLLVERPQREPRRPIQFALAENAPFLEVTLEAEVKRDGGSLMLVYAYRDATHFNYAHLSEDTAKKEPVHNGIFHVYGGERVRISSEEGPAALPSAEEWYKVRLDYDAATGAVKVAVNGRELPSLKAVDVSLGAGRVGIGSFFNKGAFRGVKITGRPAAQARTTVR